MHPRGAQIASNTWAFKANETIIEIPQPLASAPANLTILELTDRKLVWSYPVGTTYGCTVTITETWAPN